MPLISIEHVTQAELFNKQENYYKLPDVLNYTMTTVNEACSGLIDAVNSSGLDFSLNLTPYSLHFYIRRKLSKITKNNRLLQTNTSQDEIELLRMRSEYEKLYNFCQFETKQKSELEADLIKELNVKSEL